MAETHADEHGRPYDRGGLIPGPAIRVSAHDFFEYVGEHVVYADGSMKRWTGDALVPCTGCDHPDHRIAAAAIASLPAKP